MRTILRALVRGLGALVRNAWTFRRQTGHSLLLWAVFAVLNFAAQIVFRRHLDSGEFGMLNSLLGVVGLFLVPVVALRHAFDFFQPRAHDAERNAVRAAGRVSLVGIFTVVWAFCVPLLLFLVLALLGFPRASLGFFTLAAVLFTLGALVGITMCEDKGRRFFLGCLLLGAAVARLLFALLLAPSDPWAETGVAAAMVASFILLAPLWRETQFDFSWAKARAVWRDREFSRHALATFSIVLGLFLFTNGDRIVAQSCFGRPSENNMGYVPWSVFDSYQAAGLLGRSILWGTQPLLLLLLVRRAGAEKTSPALRNLFWGYAGAVIGAALLLAAFSGPLAAIFGGADETMTAYFIGGFAWVMVPLGLLQGLGIFALASRRYPECFTLGGASLGYLALLYVVGRPQLMLSYVFGGGSVALMLVLLVGLVRWGRRQP